jgi:hypothetical protein
MYPNMPYYGNQFNQGNYGFNPQVPGFRQRRTIERVHGKKGAEAYQHQLGPDESVVLLDDRGPIIWIIITDSAGYPTVCTPYDISPHKEPEEISQEMPSNDYSNLEERISRLERRLNNGKPYSGNARQSQQSETGNKSSATS